MISGHTDVVPVEGQTWDSDPFTLRVEGSRAYGRGVCDMKGFLGVALWLLPQVARGAAEGSAAFRVLLRRGNRVRRRPHHA